MDLDLYMHQSGKTEGAAKGKGQLHKLASVLLQYMLNSMTALSQQLHGKNEKIVICD